MEKKNVIKEFRVYILLVVILVAGFAITGMQAAQKAKAEEERLASVLYVPGTYTGHGAGFHGPDSIHVTITVDENTILDVVVEHDGETPGMGGKEAVENVYYAERFLELQGAEIPEVNIEGRASFTTAGVKEAYADALAQAKAGVEQPEE